mgnify:CR=1 FL=1
MSRGPSPFVLPMLAEFLCQRIALGGAWALEMDGRGGAVFVSLVTPNVTLRHPLFSMV